jgi:hypothetical protein
VNKADRRDLLTLDGLQDLRAELCTSVCHGKSRRASSILCFDDFVTTELDTLDECGMLIF